MKVSLTGFKIPVDNLDDAIEFYTEKLFFSLLFREDSFGWATVQLENQNVGLYIPGKGGGDRTVGGTVDFSFLIDDFQKYFEKVKEQTKDVSSDVITTADNLKIFETTDPSGNVVTFRESPE